MNSSTEEAIYESGAVRISNLTEEEVLRVEHHFFKLFDRIITSLNDEVDTLVSLQDQTAIVCCHNDSLLYGQSDP